MAFLETETETIEILYGLSMTLANRCV